jgi:pilus assembly protein CpaE
MFIQLSAIIVDQDMTNRDELGAFLRSRGLTIAASLANVEDLRATLQRMDTPQVVIVNLDPQATTILDSIDPLPRTYSQAAFFAMSQVMDPNLLMRIMSVGFREFIPLPMAESVLMSALERVVQVHGISRRARVIHVVPTVGGCGSTTVACNLAASLAVTGKKTCLLDFDLVRGGVASYFDVRASYTIADVMQSADRVDQQLVENALVKHEPSRLFIMARPELPEETQRVTQQGTRLLLNILSRMFDYVVIDSVMSVDPTYSTLLLSSDVTLVITQLNVPSAKNAERFVGTMRRMGVESSRVKVVVNRFVKKGWDLAPHEVERALGLEIGWMVPNDYKNAIAAINYGEPVVLRSPRSEMSQSLRGLAARLTEEERRAAA